MKINELLNESKFRKPITVFHGTSSIFLRSILKKGMEPKPKEKVWATDPDASIDRPSRASVGGSYWTSNFLTADSSAGNAKRKFGGNRLYIIAQIAEGSSFADEDSVSFSIASAYDFAVKELVGNIYPSAIHLYLQIFYDDPVKKQQFIETFAKRFHEKTVPDTKIPLPMKILEETCMAIVHRYIAYTIAGKGGLYNWGNESLHSKLFQDIKNKPESVLSVQEAEQNYLNALAKVTKYYRQIAQYSSEKYSHTLRTEEPVSFKGSNKITHILESKRDENDNEYFVLHYGSKTLPENFIKNYESKVGKLPAIKISSKLKQTESSTANKLSESEASNVHQLQTKIKSQFPQLSGFYIHPHSDDIKIDTLIVNKNYRGAGIGSKVLDILKDYADQNKKRLILTAGQRDTHIGTTSFARLDKFYKKNGFTRNSGRNKDFSITATHYYDARNTPKE